MSATKRAYLGDDDVPDGDKKSSASKILEKIKTEAKKRKTEQLSARNISEDDGSKSEASVRKSLKKKKAKFEEVENKDERKTKKRKLKDISKEEVEDDKLLKKKKKRKSDFTKEEEAEEENRLERKHEEETEATEKDTSVNDDMEDGDSTNELDEKRFPVLGNFEPKSAQKVSRVLPEWLSNPDVITADLRSTTLPVGDMTGLDSDLVQKLHDNNITTFFPVQIQVIPMLLDSIICGITVGKAGYRPNDICVSAPTGSGKTLAFVLPIVQALRGRVYRQVYAMAVLPVQDLAQQVFKVFQTYCKGTDIKVGLLTGQKPFAVEQKTLVKRCLRGYQSLVDIIVATPGRLVDHINQTPGFNLTGLRFLVIDEADKMMELIKQDWLVRVEKAVYSDPSVRPEPQILTPESCLKPQIPLQKMLFSATLSQNPEKLQQLNLFQPKLFTSVVKGNQALKPVDLVSCAETKEDSNHPLGNTPDAKGEFVGKYTTPQGLSEYFVECTAATKPLIILHYLHNLHFTNVLCFTKSVEATHRLYHLIRLFGGKEVREFSSGLHVNRRKHLIKEFSNGKVDIIICTDALARGMDIDNVKFVISYDPAPVIKTHIHRVGRTARAGKVGTAITLLQHKEFYHFKKMTREAGKTGIKEEKVSEEFLEPFIPAFQKALEEVPHILKAEKIKKKSNG